QAGICETDLQLRKGYMGFSGVLGHEFVGIARDGAYAGQRVVGEINCNCQQCEMCCRGLGNHCPHRTVIGIDRHDGAFAQQLAIPQANLHLVPDSVSNDEAVFTEPLAAAFQIGRQVDLDGARVVVLGDGRLAMLCAQAILLHATDVTVIGKHPRKLARFDPLPLRTLRLDQPTEPKSFDVVVDCTGSESGMKAALQLVRPRGTVVMKTTIAAEHLLSLAPVVIDEISVVGSRCGPFDEALDALANQRVDVSDLITHRFPLHQVRQAMDTACDPEAMKVVFDVVV
ncbi:MAG: alcohol dehydrogenase catalytic domain-containing protein, partial [Planctomycetes bacterium]|nr:alcohol dehydrogenase catalytic domain-containing protein [Planctomycetota bacterium]